MVSSGNNKTLKQMDSQIYTSSTSLSSSSSSGSRKGSPECAFYADYASDKKKKSKKSVKRSLSFGLGSVKEENEEMEEFEQTRFPQLRLPNDNFEFRLPIRNTRFQNRRRASLSPNCTRGLPRVEEVDDDEHVNKCIFKLGLMLDKNEFNSKLIRKIPTLKIEESSSIPEDLLENIKEPKQAMPAYKLKVDEMDYIDKKQWNPQQSEIEVIEEEKPEYDANAKEKEMFKQIKKILVEERVFLKKILKGDCVQEEDLQKQQQFLSLFGENHWNLLIQEAEENGLSSDDDQ